MTHFKPRRWLLAFALLTFLSMPAYAELFIFATRPAFNAAAPGLSVETFESGLVGPGAGISCTGPVSSAMSLPCFPTGSLLPGVVYSASPGRDLVVLGAGFPGVGNPSRVIGPNNFADTFNLRFANANAVGFDVFAGPGGGQRRDLYSRPRRYRSCDSLGNRRDILRRDHDDEVDRPY
jgi:hypothetical protein